jgi:type II secretory pathway component PulC
MAAAGERQQALIRAEGKAYGAWIGIGSEIEGWRLARIEADRVVIEKDGEEEELAIRATRSD